MLVAPSKYNILMLFALIFMYFYGPVADSTLGHRDTLTLMLHSTGQMGACAHGEVNIMHYASFLINNNSVLDENSYFKRNTVISGYQVSM